MGRKVARVVKETVLIFGEGKEDYALLCYLRDLYITRESPRMPTIDRGNGGSPLEVVGLAHKTPGVFVTKLVCVDSDRPEIEEARTQAKKHKLEILTISPCMEGLLLEILEPQKKWRLKTTDQCKSRFENRHIQRKKRSTSTSYRVLTYEVIQEARLTIVELDKIVGTMTGEFLHGANKL